MAKQNNIAELPNLASNHLENLFQVEQDEDGMYYYDLSDTVYLDQDNINPLNYTTHEVTRYDSLYTLSLKYYKTKSLWWVIGVTNNIDNPFVLTENVGEEIKILTPSFVGEMLKTIKR